MLAAYLAAWRQGDASACTAFYARDARMEDSLLPSPLEGRDRIEEYFRRGFAERAADTTRDLVNVAIDESRIFFEWTIASAEGGSRGVSVWEVEDGEIKRDRSYWHRERGPDRDARGERGGAPRSRRCEPGSGREAEPGDSREKEYGAVGG